MDSHQIIEKIVSFSINFYQMANMGYVFFVQKIFPQRKNSVRKMEIICSNEMNKWTYFDQTLYSYLY